MTGSRISCAVFGFTLMSPCIHAAIFRQIVRKNVLAKIPKGNTGYGQYTFPVVPDTIAVEPTFVDFL